MTAPIQRPSFLDDPVALEIIWHRLVTVADQMQAVMRRTAFSTIIAAANDLGCEIMDARGWSVAHATTSNPTFNLVLPHLAQSLLPLFPPESLAPGDVLVTNDPWLAAGHLGDICVVTPFFKDGRLVGFTGSIGHVPDIGGLLNNLVSRSVYEEGLYLPPLKLYVAGKRDEIVVAIIRRNVRTPEMTMGDIMALVTANEVAARQTLALLDEYGLDDLQAVSDAVQGRAEAAMRQAIREIPDGDYACETTLDELDGPLTIGGIVRVRGSDLVVDFVRVPPEHSHGGINVAMSYTRARTNYALNCVLVPHLPSNEGLFRPIRIQAPEGSLLNVRHPASVTERQKVGFHVERVIYGALSQAIPRKTVAPGGFASVLRTLGVNDRGVPFSEFLFTGGGLGAGLTGDGVDGICYPTSSCSVSNEILESTTGILVSGKEFLADSGGPGRTRGGCGLRAAVGIPDDLQSSLTVTAWCYNMTYPAFGIAGGRPGTATQVRLNGDALPVDEIRHKLGGLVVDDPNLRITLETAGGGGFGDPAERDPSQILADVRNGRVSVAAAARDYGVEVDLDRLRARRVAGNS